MKTFITSILLISFAFSNAQTCPKGPAQIVNSYYQFWGVKVPVIFQLPRVAPLSTCIDTAMLYFNTVDQKLHWWTGTKDTTFVGGQVVVNNGIFLSTDTVQLGEPLGQSGSPAKFINNREIPLNGKTFTLWDSLSSVATREKIVFNDTSRSTNIGVYKTQVKQWADSTKDSYMWNEWKPKNFGYLYSGYKPNGALAKAMDWSWGYSQNSSGGLSMPDNVFGGGYNILNAVGRKDTGDASCSLRLETSFPVFGQPVFELHWPEITHFDGSMQRVNSWYTGKINGNTLWESNLDDHVYKRGVGIGSNPGGNWLEFTSNSGDFGSIILTGTHANSIGGIISFADSTGQRCQIGSLDAVMRFTAATGGVSTLMDKDGSMYFNYSDNALVSNGTTIVGNYPGPIPSTDASAQLKVISTTKGFLPPVMTTTQKNAISNPGEGLTVYDKTLHKLCVFTGSVWETITSL